MSRKLQQGLFRNIQSDTTLIDRLQGVSVQSNQTAALNLTVPTQLYRIASSRSVGICTTAVVLNFFVCVGLVR